MKSMPLKQKSILLLAIICTVSLSSCRSSNKKSNLEGFAAITSDSTQNVAILITAYGSTPGYAGMFEQDLNNMNAVLTDKSANYDFKTFISRNAGHNTMMGNIAYAAQNVSPDGTLMVYITAHGSTNGAIQPGDQAYATFGYGHIVQSIRNGRAGKPAFKRLVVVISACYSGSWLNTLQYDKNLFSEYMVMTSVNAGSLSMIGSATSAMYSAFVSLKNNPSATMLQFYNTTRAYNGNVQAVGYPQSIWNDLMINKTTVDTTKETSTEKMVASETPEATKETSGVKYARAESIDAKMIGVTQTGTDGKFYLYLYSSRVLTSLSYWVGGTNYIDCKEMMAPQAAWPFICRVYVSDGYKTIDSLKANAVANGVTANNIEIPLVHN